MRLYYRQHCLHINSVRRQNHSEAISGTRRDAAAGRNHKYNPNRVVRYNSNHGCQLRKDRSHSLRKKEDDVTLGKGASSFFLPSKSTDIILYLCYCCRNAGMGKGML